MFVSKKRLEGEIEKSKQLQESLDSIEQTVEEQQSDIRSLEKKKKKLEEEIAQLQMENQSLKGLLYGTEQSDETKVEIKFKNDLTGMFPLTKINKESVKFLVEQKYLPYNRQEESESQSLALILYASDALNSFITEFEEEPVDVETNDAH